MPGQTGGIDVGDAVMNFVANSTELDAYLARLETQVPAAMVPPKAAIADLSNTLQGMSTYFGQVPDVAVPAMEEVDVAVEKTAFNMREAKGEIALLGEEIGIKIPRHVRGFLAELPGVGTALESAFAATAVLILLQVLVEGTKKLSEWVAETFIYTEALKDVEKRTTELNVKLLEQQVNLKASKEAVETFGLSARQLADRDLAKLTTSLDQNIKKFQEASAELAKLNGVSIDTPNIFARASATMLGWFNVTIDSVDAWKKHREELLKNQDAVQLLDRTIAAQKEAQLQKQQIADKALKDEQTKAAEVSIEIQKAQGQASLNQQDVDGKLQFVAVKNNTLALSILKSAEDEKRFQLDLTAMKQRLSLLTDENQETWNKRAKLNSDIELLEKAHTLKLEQNYLTFRAALAAARAVPIPLIDEPTPPEIKSQILTDFQQIHDAASAVGISLSSDLFKAAQDAGYAYNLLKNSGEASLGDLLRAQIKLTEATKAYRQDLGLSTKDQQKLLIGLNDQLDKLNGKVDKTQHKTSDFFKQWQLDMKHTVSGMEDMKNMGAQAFNQLAAGIESAVASAILAQKGLGQALEQATAQALASLAAQALVKAIFYTAEGFAALAGFSEYSAGQYFAAAAEMGVLGVAAGAAGRALSSSSSAASTGSAGSGSTGTAPVIASAPPQPVQTTNVQRFAGGGLVSGPTLAMIGDSTKNNGKQEEAALPLDDPQAVKKIVEALGGGGGPTIHLHVKGMVSPDNLKKVIKDINRKVSSGQVNLTSSNSFRVTKRSS